MFAAAAVVNRLCAIASSKEQEDCDDLRRLENRNIAHDSGNSDVLNRDEFRFAHGFPIFEEHRYHLAEVGVQLIQRGALGMCAGEAWNEANKETGLRIALDYGGVCFGTSAQPGEFRLTDCLECLFIAIRSNFEAIASRNRDFPVPSAYCGRTAPSNVYRTRKMLASAAVTKTRLPFLAKPR